jgi:hypothetical protein
MYPPKIDLKAIKRFNTLPRHPRSPSGLVDNHWHFDLRFVYLEPPGHILFLIQPESTYIHTGRLPLGIPNKSQTLLFFPESGAEAAPEVAKALIHAFLDGFGIHQFDPKPPAPYAPWSLSTEDRELAAEVEKEFRRLGVIEELCHIKATKAHVKTADKAFTQFWLTMIQGLSLPTPLMQAMVPPEGINFSVFKPRPWGEEETPDEMERALKYAQMFHRVDVKARRLPNSQVSAQMLEKTQAAMEFLESKSSEEAQREADAGSDAAALDYAVR